MVDQSETAPARQTMPASPAVLPGPLLEQIVVRFGAPDVLATFLLFADAAMRERGIRMEIGTFAELAELNRQHFGSWGRLVTMFDERIAPVPLDRSVCVFGRNGTGEVVCAIAGRTYDLTGTSLRDEVSSNRLFYPNGRAPEGERCELSAPIGTELAGVLCYGGAHWIRPDYRGLRISPILGRIIRCVVMSNFGFDNAATFVSNKLVESGVAAGYGFSNSQRAFRRFVNGKLDFEGCIVWQSEAGFYACLQDLMVALSDRGAVRLDGAQAQ